MRVARSQSHVHGCYVRVFIKALHFPRASSTFGSSGKDSMSLSRSIPEAIPTRSIRNLHFGVYAILIRFTDSEKTVTCIQAIDLLFISNPFWP